jgi:hypothetical protein
MIGAVGAANAVGLARLMLETSLGGNTIGS